MTLKNLAACAALGALVSGCASSPIAMPSGSLPIVPAPDAQQPALPASPVGIAIGSIKPIEKPVLHIAPTWTMTAGHTVGQELQAWGAKAGWKVIWTLPKDWSVPAPSHFMGDFPTAASEVIQTLAANGALIHAQFFEGNKTLVISGPGVAAQ